MIIACCILGTLLLLAILAVAFLWYTLNIILDEYLEHNPIEVIKYYFETQCEEKFPCTLLLSVQGDADFNGSVFDFSKYNDSKIIAMTEYKTDNNTKYLDEDGNSIVVILTDQEVYKMKDGSYQWNFQSLL